MKTKEELNGAILSITMKMQEEFPELTENLIETPVHYSRNKGHGVNKENLVDYYNSLLGIFKGYAETHLKKNLEEHKGA